MTSKLDEAPTQKKKFVFVGVTSRTEFIWIHLVSICGKLVRDFGRSTVEMGIRGIV